MGRVPWLLKSTWMTGQRDTGTEIQTYIKTYIQTDRHTSSDGTYWVPLESSVGINSSLLWTPTLVILIVIEIIYIIKTIEYKYKTSKGPWTTRRTDRLTDILYCQSGYLTPWTESTCIARNYGPHDLIAKNWRGQPDRETERKSDRNTDK